MEDRESRKENSPAKTYQQCPERIFNADETGVARCVGSNDRYIAPVGAANPGHKAGGGDKDQETMLCWGDAAGQQFPSVFIQKGKVHADDYTAAARPGTGVILQNDTHMINGKTLVEVLQFFKQQIDQHVPRGLSPENRVLFLFDGHESRLGPDAVSKAVEMGIDIHILPPNSTHFLQPWDQIFGVVKQYYKRLYDAWIQLPSNAKRTLSRMEWLALADWAVALALKKNPDLLKKAFKLVGIFPLDINRPLAYMRQHGVPDLVAAAAAAQAMTDAEVSQLIQDAVNELKEVMQVLLQQAVDGEAPAVAVPLSGRSVGNRLAAIVQQLQQAAAAATNDASTSGTPSARQQQRQGHQDSVAAAALAQTGSVPATQQQQLQEHLITAAAASLAGSAQAAAALAQTGSVPAAQQQLQEHLITAAAASLADSAQAAAEAQTGSVPAAQQPVQEHLITAAAASLAGSAQAAAAVSQTGSVPAAQQQQLQQMDESAWDEQVQKENAARQQELDQQRALDMLPGTFDVMRAVFGDRGPCVKPKTEVIQLLRQKSTCKSGMSSDDAAGQLELMLRFVPEFVRTINASGQSLAGMTQSVRINRQVPWAAARQKLLAAAAEARVSGAAAAAEAIIADKDRESKELAAAGSVPAAQQQQLQQMDESAWDEQDTLDLLASVAAEDAADEQHGHLDFSGCTVTSMAALGMPDAVVLPDAAVQQFVAAVTAASIPQARAAADRQQQHDAVVAAAAVLEQQIQPTAAVDEPLPLNDPMDDTAAVLASPRTPQQLQAFSQASVFRSIKDNLLNDIHALQQYRTQADVIHDDNQNPDLDWSELRSSLTRRLITVSSDLFAVEQFYMGKATGLLDAADARMATAVQEARAAAAAAAAAAVQTAGSELGVEAALGLDAEDELDEEADDDPEAAEDPAVEAAMTENEDQLADIEPRPVAAAAAACLTPPAISIVDDIAVAAGQLQPPAPEDQQQSAFANWLQRFAEATAALDQLKAEAPAPQAAQQSASYHVRSLQCLISEEAVLKTVLQPLADDVLASDLSTAADEDTIVQQIMETVKGKSNNKKRKHLRLNGVITSTSYTVAYQQSVAEQEMLQAKKKKKTEHATTTAATAAAAAGAPAPASNTARDAPARRGGRKAARSIQDVENTSATPIAAAAAIPVTMSSRAFGHDITNQQQSQGRTRRRKRAAAGQEDTEDESENAAEQVAVRTSRSRATKTKCLQGFRLNGPDPNDSQ